MGILAPEYIFQFQDCDAAGKPVTTLKHQPDGWKEYGVCFGRETGVSNVVKSYTNSWKFYKEDAAYIRTKLFTCGVNRRIRLLVKHLTDSLALTYEVEYSGYLDLTQVRIEEAWVSVPISEGGLFKALENRWGDDYRMQLDSVCRVTGAAFTNEAVMLNQQTVEDQQNGTGSWVGYVLLGGEMQDSGDGDSAFFKDTGLRFLESYIDTDTYRDALVSTVSLSDAFMVVEDGYLERLHINFSMRMLLTASHMYAFARLNRCRYQLYVASTPYSNVENGGGVALQNGVNSNFYLLQTVEEQRKLSYHYGTNRYAMDFSGEYDIQDVDCTGGRVFFLLARIYWGDPSANELWGGSASGWDDRYPAFIDDTTSISIYYQRFRFTFGLESVLNVDKPVSVRTVPSVFRELFTGIAQDYDVEFRLSQFDALAKNDLLTSGGGLRGVDSYQGIEYPQGHLETSLEAFLKFCMVVYNYRLCIDYDRTSDKYIVKLLHFDSLYNTGNAVVLNAVDNLVVSVNRDMLYTSIRCGYETRDDAINGLSEYNCIFNWLTPNTGIEETELDLVSPYSAATRTIETYMFENYGEGDDSDEKDNDIFLIGGVRSQHTQIEIPDYSQLPLLDVTVVRWNDTLVIVNNPDNNGGYKFVNYVWFRNDFEHQVAEGVQYITELNLSAGDTYFCVLTDTNGNMYVTMYPFVAGYVIEPPEELPVSDFDVYTVRRSGVQATSGVAYPERAWNLDFTPGRILRRHKRELNSYMAFCVGKNLVMNSCERNDALVAGGLTENADIAVTGSRDFLPVLIEVDSPAARGMIARIEANRIGCMTFTFRGREYKGFIADGEGSVTVNPMCSKASTFRLLAGPDLDLA